MTSFAERLKTLRVQSELTQLELANRIGVNKQTISQYERGIRQPDFEILEALCDFFNVSSDYLLGQTNVTIRFLNTEDLAKLSRNRTRCIPVFGTSITRYSEEAVSDIDAYLDIPSTWEGDYSGFIVNSDRMSPVIRKGDTVIFRLQENAEAGSIVIALINKKEITIGKLIKRESAIILTYFNPVYDPIVFDSSDQGQDIRILGKIVENRQKF